MIRSFLGLGGSKHLSMNSGKLIAPLKIFSFRHFCDSKVAQLGKKRFIFSDKEAERTATVGPVQAHLSLGEGAARSREIQKKLSVKKSQIHHLTSKIPTK